jgi:ERF superfamily protein
MGSMAVDQMELATVPAPAEESMLSIIGKAALDPRVDVEKMKALLELKERIDDNEAKKLFHAAMIAAQEEMRPVVRNCINTDSGNKYANLEAIDSAIRPIYTKHGFVLSFNSEPGTAGMIVMSCTCMHKGGFAKEYRMEGALDDSGIKGTRNKTGVMAAGSTVSYLRRYVTCMIFNIVLTNEDNDGASTKYISPDQVRQISDMILACEMDAVAEAKFCAMLNAKTVEQILACNYDVAMTQLRAKYRSRGGK